jgi:hypothetical protein
VGDEARETLGLSTWYSVDIVTLVVERVVVVLAVAFSAKVLVFSGVVEGWVAAASWLELVKAVAGIWV